MKGTKAKVLHQLAIISKLSAVILKQNVKEQSGFTLNTTLNYDLP